MIAQIAVHGFDKNFSYVVHDDAHAAVVDPSGSIEHVYEYINKEGLVPVSIVITHTHFDHHDKLQDFHSTYPVPVYVHGSGTHALSIDVGAIAPISDGDVIAVGSLEIEVLHTPGHIDDAVCFFIPEEGALITGDTLFVEGCGRVGSEKNAEVLYESLERLKNLPDNTKIFPGHDYGSQPHSTIKWEKEHNRFFLAKDVNAFKKERLG